MLVSLHRRVFGWIAAAWLAFVVALSFLPFKYKQELHTKGRLHDVGHILVFGMFAFLLSRTARTRDQLLVRLFLAAALGVAIEIAQDLRFVLPDGSYTPVEWGDVLMDTMAVVMVAVAELGIMPLVRRSRLSARDRRAEAQSNR